MSAPARSFLARAGKRDPELYGIAAVTVGMLGAFGFWAGRKPTTGVSTEEDSIKVPHGSQPWKGDDAQEGRSLTEMSK